MATTAIQPAVGSYGYDLANNLAPGTSSSGDYKVPVGAISPTPAASPVAPINSDALKPVTPVNLPPTPVDTSSTAASGAIGAMAGINDNIQKDLKTQSDALQAKVDSRGAKIDSYISQLENKQADITAAENAAGIPALRDTAKALAEEYNTKTLAYNEQNRAISQDQSMSSDQRARQLAAVANDHAYEMNGLAIRSNIATGNYQAAQALVDKAIDIKYGGLKDLITYQSALLSDDKSALSDKEKTQLQIKLDENKRKLDEVTYQEHELQNTKTDLLKSAAAQNAPQSVQAAIQNAKDKNGAIVAAGQYAGDILDRELKRKQLEKINAEIRKTNAEAGALQIPTVNNPDGAKYKTALSIILASQNLTKEQKATITNAINTGGDPFSIIKNQAKNIMGQTEATTVTKYETAQSSLNKIKESLDSYYKAGGKTNILSGSYEKVVNNLGAVNDPKLVELATEIQANLQVYRNAVSGTAYSVQEGADIASIFPGINKTEGLNNAIINGRNKAFDSTIDGAYSTVLGKSYADIKKAEATVDTKPTGPVDANPFQTVMSSIFNPKDGYIIPTK